MKRQRKQWLMTTAASIASLALFQPAAVSATQNEAPCITDGSPNGNASIENLNRVVSKLDTLDLNGCGNMITSEDEIRYLHKLDDLDASYWRGDITAAELQSERAAVRKKFNPKADPNLDKLLAVGVAAQDKQWVKGQIGLAALDVANGHSMPESLKKKLMERSGLTAEQLNSVVQGTAAPFKRYAQSLKDAGVGYLPSSHTWDLSNAHFNINDLQSRTGKTTLKSALALFLSAPAMKAISDPTRQQPIGISGPKGKKLLILPPSRFDKSAKPGDIRIISEDDYNAGLKKALAQYKQARTDYLVSSKAQSSMWNMLKSQGLKFGACWGTHCLPHAPYTSNSSDAEKENNRAYNSMNEAEHEFLDLGAPAAQVQQLQRDALATVEQGGRDADRAVAKSNAVLNAMITAEKGLTYYAATAGFGELLEGSEAAQSVKVLGTVARLARNGAAGFKAMAAFPLYLAGATSAYDAGVDTVKYGGGFMCHFAENLADQGPAAVKSAVNFGLMGAAGAGVGAAAELYGFAAKGADAAKAAEMGQKASAGIQRATGAYFSATMVDSGVKSLVNCGEAIAANNVTRDPYAHVATSSQTWKVCGQSAIDATFAYQGGKDFVHSGSDVIAGIKADGIRGGAKAYFTGAPVVTDVSKIDISKPQRVADSINKLASEPDLFTQQSFDDLAQRLAKEGKPKNLAALLKDPSGPVSTVAAQALSLRHDPESAKILENVAERTPTDSWLNPLKTVSNIKAVAQRVIFDRAQGLIDATGMSDKTQHLLHLDPVREHLAQLASPAGQAKNVLITRAQNGDPEAQSYLLKMAVSSDPSTNMPALDGAKSLTHSEEFANVLKKGLKAKDKQTQVTAARLLAQNDTPAANQAISDLVADSRSNLGKFMTSAESPIRKAVTGQPASTIPEVLEAVTQGLAARSDSASADALIDATKSKDTLLRGMAKVALADREWRLNGTAPAPELTKQELTAYNKFRLEDAKQRKKNHIYAAGDKIIDKSSGNSFTLLSGGWSKNVDGGWYYVGRNDGTGEKVWFSDADLKKGKSSVEVVKAEPVKAEAPKPILAENRMKDELPADGADPDTYAKRKSDPSFNRTVEDVSNGLTKIFDKLSLSKKYNFHPEDRVALERTVEALKPREIEELKEKLKVEPEKLEQLEADILKDCDGAGVASNEEWDPSGTFRGILYAKNTTACDL